MSYIPSKNLWRVDKQNWYFQLFVVLIHSVLRMEIVSKNNIFIDSSAEKSFFSTMAYYTIKEKPTYRFVCSFLTMFNMFRV